MTSRLVISSHTLINILAILTMCVSHSAALRCYSCSFSFNEQYDAEHRDAWCANESLVLLETNATSKLCAPWEGFCVTAVMTINKAFTSVSRGCGERCSELCESDGYGQDQVNCDDCCEEDLCNYNFSLQYYMVMMEAAYTSWTKPLPGERNWNAKSGIRFPSSLFGGIFGNGAVPHALPNFITLLTFSMYTNLK